MSDISLNNETEVFIAGKSFKLKGNESAEYFHKIADYINFKIKEIENKHGFKFTASETQSALIYINIADDYFKIKDKIEQLQSELEQKNKEIYELKHDIVNLEMKLEETEKS